MRRLAADCGEFAALVYSWAIPHAADDGSLPADPDELLMLVVPGFRWRTTEDMHGAIDGMLKLGLLEQHGDKLMFPPAAFYKYQTYVAAERRETAQNSAEQRVSPRNAEEQRETPSSSYLTSYSSLSKDPTLSLRATNARMRARETDPCKFCSACSTTLPRRRPAHGLCADCHGKALVNARAADVDIMHISLEQLAEFARRS